MCRDVGLHLGHDDKIGTTRILVSSQVMSVATTEQSSGFLDWGVEAIKQATRLDMFIEILPHLTGVPPLPSTISWGESLRGVPESANVEKDPGAESLYQPCDACQVQCSFGPL
jgi:hypothetical protein